MRISKSMAESIASKERARKYDEEMSKTLTELKKELEKEVIKKFKSFKLNIPQELIDAEYVRLESTVNFKINGEKYIQREEMFNPHPITTYGFEHNIETTEKIEKLWKKHENLKKESHKFYRDLERIINSFTNHKSLLVHLPELQEYFKDADLAKSMAVVPIEQIKAVRDQLVKRTKA